MKFKKALAIGIADDDLDTKYWQQIDELAESIVKLPKGDPKIKDEITDTDCLLLGFQIDINKELIESAKDLKYIGVMATAYGTIDIEFAASRNIPVCNLAGYSSESVAEFTIAILLAQMRQLEKGRQNAQKADYSFAGFSARELKDSKFGVIGLGSIGNRVAKLAEGFGADVSYWSRNDKQTKFKRIELDKLLSSSDYISINIAETEETKGLINADNLKLVKPSAVMVSTVPPEVVDAEALAEKLKTDKDFVFISDHPDEMSEEYLSKIKNLPNCILYPPIGFITDEARRVKQEMFVGNIKAALAGKPENRVN